MKLQKTIELTGNDIVKDYISPTAAALFKLDVKPEQVKISVYSETKKEFIKFDGKNIKFVWSEE